MQDCHFCDNQYCRDSCPLPFSSTMTFADLLKKVDVEDNVSFYNGNRGKSDVILNMTW